MLQVGLIGLGFISVEHVPGYVDCDDARIVAVCDTDAAAAKAWQAKHRLEHATYYADYHTMLANEDLDIVEVLTPHHLHCEMVEAAASAGIRGISVQKPMGVSLCEADRMIEVCRENSATLRVYENAVFFPVYLKAKELMNEGIIGELVTIRSHTTIGIRDGLPKSDWPRFWNPESWRASLDKTGSGPIVGDHGYHRFSTVSWFADRDVETISSWIDDKSSLDAPAFVRAKFKTAAGEPHKFAQIDFTFMPKMAIPCDFWLDDFVEIVGERGMMWINQGDGGGDRDVYRELELSSSPLFPPIIVFVDGKVRSYLADLPLHERNWSKSFVASTRDFIGAVLHGTKPRLTGEEGKKIKRYTIAAHLSAQERRDVSVDEVTSANEAKGSLRVSMDFCNL